MNKALTVAAGLGALILGVVLLVPLPELGLPAALGGLRLLGRHYAWARAANDRIDGLLLPLRRRWHDAPPAARLVTQVVLGALVVGVVWYLVVRHFGA